MRFKFTCTCGKRLAAYSWMVGKITECPKCNTTMTIPTPERAAQLLGERAGELATRYHLRHPSRRHRKLVEWLLAFLVFLLAMGTGILLGWLYFRPHV